MRVMLDTNVRLSGLFFQGNERRLLELILHNELEGVVSETSLRECEAVMERKFGQSAKKDQAIRLLALLKLSLELIWDAQAKAHLEEAKSTIRHANDAPILAAALHAAPDYFVTGDQDFFHLRENVSLKVIACAELLEKIHRN